MRFLMVVLALLCASPAVASTVSGRAEVIDGDSLRIGGQTVRLHGVDAFERGQMCAGVPCGREATARMRAMVRDALVVCARTDTDRYGRMVARCRVGETDLGAALVRAGWAFAYTRYSAAYLPDQRAAERARAGVWATGQAVTAPWTWRAARAAS